MRVVFYMSDKWRESLLSLAFCHGVAKAGDQPDRVMTQDYEEPDVKTDAAVVFGVKGFSKRIMDDHQTLGRAVIYMDKGYLPSRAPVSNRRSRAHYYKVSLGGFQPLGYLETCPPDRWHAFRDEYRIELKPWRDKGEHILWLGPSQKYCDFHGLGDAHKFSAKVISRLVKNTHRPVIYRPKHSWRDAEPIPGSKFSENLHLKDDLKDCFAVATHGSNSSVPAIIQGIPVFALGPAITRPIAETDLGDLWRIKCPTNEERESWLRSICYWQWTIAEMDQGLAWEHIRKRI